MKLLYQRDAFAGSRFTKTNRYHGSKGKLSWKQRAGVVAALPAMASQMPRKYLSFLVMSAANVFFCQARLSDYLMERGAKETSISVYGPNRGLLQVVDVEADQGQGGGCCPGGGVDPHVLRQEIEQQVSQLCNNIGYRVYNVLRNFMVCVVLREW